MRSVRIVGDGTTFGTRVYDAETGAQIEDIVYLRVEHVPNQLPIALVTLRRPIAAIQAEAIVATVQ